MIREFYKNRTILLTGVTGFLGKGVAAKILRDLPQVRRLYVLIRPRKRPDGSVFSVEERLEEDFFATSVFDQFKKSDPQGYEKVRDKIVPFSGDFITPELGLEPRFRAQLLEEVDLIINNAATVEFDAPLDFSLKLNTLGPRELLEFSRACRRDVVFLQVSTAYVNGKLSGLIPEEPLPVDRTIRQMMQSTPPQSPFDPEAEIEDCQDSCQKIYARAASQEQQQAFRKEILSQRYGRQLSDKRLDKLVEDRCKGWTEHQLIEEGMRRAKAYGWNDTYTFTKAMGEQMLVKHRGEVSLVIVRPSVIESSLKDPEPGWISGLKVTDPLIVAYGRGLVPDFPARPDVAMDLIPVDMVVNAILGAATQATREEVRVFQIATSGENLLTNGVLFEYIQRHFRDNPMRGKGGQIPSLPQWTFPSERKFRTLFHLKYMYPLRLVQWLLKCLPERLAPTQKKRSLVAIRTRLQRVLYYTQLFSPYTHLDCRFEIKRTRALFDSLPPEEQGIFDMDVQQINWPEYYSKIHLPGLRKHVLKETHNGEPLLHEVPEELGAEEERWHEEEGIETIPDLVGWACTRYADRVALQIKRQGHWVRYTYGEMQQRIDSLAASWQQRGLEPGQNVLLCAENSPEWVVSYMAASSLGLTVVLLDPQTSEEEIWGLADFTEARALIASEACFASLSEESVVARRGGKQSLCFFNLENLGLPFGNAQMESPPSSKWKQPRIASDMVASIIFTSGMAVEPRGVMLTHGNFIANLLALTEVQRVYETDQILSILPLHHGLEFTGGLLMSILGGATTTYLGTLNSREILETICSTGTTAMVSVPRLLKILADRIQRLDRSAGNGRMTAEGRSLSRLRLVVSGGAPLAPEIYDAFQRLGVKICQGYGLTEAAPIVAVNPAECPRPGSVGQTLPGQEIAIDQPDERGEGEILVRGAHIMAGYFNKSELTAAVLRDGWLYTGDIGYVDEDGFVFITGRCKNLIVTGTGKNVYAEEVEALYRDLPHVAELSVVGVQSPRTLSEEVHAVAVLERGVHTQEEKKPDEEIVARSYQISRSLPRHQRIQRLHIWKRPLPYRDDGEVDRAALLSELQLERQKTSEVIEIDESLPPWERRVYQQISRMTGLSFTEVVAHCEAPMDTMLDSLMAVEFAAWLDACLDTKLVYINRSRTLRRVLDELEPLVDKKAEKLLEEGDEAEAGSYWSRVLLTAGRRGEVQPDLGRKTLQTLLWSSAGVFFRSYFSLRARGLEYLPQERPYLIAANHASYLDPASIFLAMRAQVEGMSLAVARDTFFRPFMNAVPFARGEDFRKSLIDIRSLVGARRPLLVFPEGTRSPNGQLQAFKMGIGLVALELDLPVVPVHICGTYQALPKGSRSLTRHSINLLFGKPLDMEPYRERHRVLSRYEIYREIVEALHRDIAALAEQNTQS